MPSVLALLRNWLHRLAWMAPVTAGMVYFMSITEVGDWAETLQSTG